MAASPWHAIGWRDLLTGRAVVVIVVNVGICRVGRVVRRDLCHVSPFDLGVDLAWCGQTRLLPPPRRNSGPTRLFPAANSIATEVVHVWQLARPTTASTRHRPASQRSSQQTHCATTRVRIVVIHPRRSLPARLRRLPAHLWSPLWVRRDRQLVNILALAAAWVGGILTASGPAGMGAVTKALVENVEFILIGTAIIVLLHNLAPKGVLIGPIVLAIVGLLILLTRLELWAASRTWLFIGITLTVAGVILAMRSDNRPPRAFPVLRILGALVRRRLVLSPEDYAPERLVAVAILGKLEVDMRKARLPRYGPVEVMVTCLLGRVTIAIPLHWPVAAGRVHTIRWMKLEGSLDSAHEFDDPQDDEQCDRLSELALERKESVGAREPGSAVVLHVIGVGGSVAVVGR